MLLGLEQLDGGRAALEGAEQGGLLRVFAFPVARLLRGLFRLCGLSDLLASALGVISFPVDPEA